MAKRTRRLNPEQIVDATLALVDEEGLDNLSMRRLGSSLGVEAMSLYNHFRNKADILDGLHAHLLAEMLIPGSLQGGWEEQVRAAAQAFRAVLRAHPRAIPLMASRAAVTPRSLAYFNGGVDIFLRAGLGAVDSLRAFQSVFGFVVGHAAFHFARLGEEPEDTEALYRDYPALAKVAATMPYDNDQEFDFGLDLLVTGLRQKLEREERA